MELDHLFTPRPLMQAVRILRDHRSQVAQALQLDERVVRGVLLAAFSPLIARFYGQGRSAAC